MIQQLIDVVKLVLHHLELFIAIVLKIVEINYYKQEFKKI